MKLFDVIIVGGGASGFFTAINIAENNPNLKIAILEKNKEVLSKVKISGGGRCNVTHACFIPNLLTKYYPRGENELKGPFHTFCTGDVMEWFEERGVSLKIEEDGRIFPSSDSSQTIIDCFLEECQALNISVFTQTNVENISNSDNVWKLQTSKGIYNASNLVLSTGSSNKIWDLCQSLGHNIIPPVPSLFTFKIKDERIKDLMGVSAPEVTLKVKDTPLKASGALLITHWGMSGPAILRLSAWGARILAEKNYRFSLVINWTNDLTFDNLLQNLLYHKTQNSKKTVAKYPMFELPQRLWQQLVLASNIQPSNTWADLSKKQLVSLSEQLTQSTFIVDGKSTFKDEFVTAGGIDLKEINFKTMQSKIFDNLYFTGEILDIDAITGGFNFQNAWTTGYLAAQAIASK